MADMLNISKSTLSKIENDGRMLDSILLNKFAELYEVSADYLVGRETVIRERPDQLYSAGSHRIEYLPVPIYGAIKADSNGIVHYGDFLGCKMVAKDEMNDGQYFYVVVYGNSMVEAGIPEGSHVLVKQQSMVDHGKIAVLILDGGTAELRKVFHQSNDLVVLHAANSSIAPEIRQRHGLQIVGQAVHLTREL